MTDKTVRLTIILDSEFHKQLKSFTALQGLNMKEYIMELIEKDIKLKKAYKETVKEYDKVLKNLKD